MRAACSLSCASHHWSSPVLCLQAAPAGLHGAAAGMAGTIALFALVLGLNCGALLSFAWLL
jgi:hypothetical protein